MSSTFYDNPERLFAFDLPISFYAWCHDGNQPADSAISINVSMTEPVILYGLLSGGYELSQYKSYVTAFSVAYSYHAEEQHIPTVYKRMCDTPT